MISPEASYVGSRLDADHSPETNGRMAVCRRCGAHTDTAQGGQHAPEERQLARANEWLEMQLRASRLSQSRTQLRD
jgi:hypothetical protein